MTRSVTTVSLCLLLLPGCAARQIATTPIVKRSLAPRSTVAAEVPRPSVEPESLKSLPHQPERAVPVAQVSLAAHQMPPLSNAQPIEVEEVPVPVITSETLTELEGMAVALNPTLRRLSQEATAARAKVGYMDKLPDPMVGFNIFASPIETAAGSQRANMAIMQTIPSLRRLDAQTQQACFEAMALRQLYLMERLRVVGDVRATWYRLYILRRQLETTDANLELLESIVERATSIVAAGKGSANDVRLGAIEMSRLEERKIRLNQQTVAAQAELNRLVGRNASTSVEAPIEITANLPAWDHEMLAQLARENQPAIGAAQVRTQATRWGIEVARLQRRPNITWNASWFAIDDNRRPTNLVSVGQDAWSVGAQVSIPLWHSDYDAMEREARWRHAASHASVDEVMQKYDATLRDLWEQAKSASEIVELYETTIIPEAKRTLNADTQAYGTTNVEFDRVIKDFQTVLTLQLAYDEAIGRLATALARIEQAVGIAVGN